MTKEVINELKKYTAGKKNTEKTEISVLALNRLIFALEQQEACEMSVEAYRQRMIQALHNADCDELIVVCVLPTEKEFEHLEWWLKNNYKKEPCEDCVSRQAVEKITWEEPSYTDALNALTEVREKVRALPPVTPQSKWITDKESEV